MIAAIAMLMPRMVRSVRMVRALNIRSESFSKSKKSMALGVFDKHDDLDLAHRFFRGGFVESDAIFCDRGIEAFQELDLADVAFETQFERGLQAHALFGSELHMETLDEVVGKARDALDRIALQDLDLVQDGLSSGRERARTQAVPAGSTLLEVQIETFGERADVDILEEELFEEGFGHGDLLLVEFGEEMGKELLRLERHKEDIDLLRKEALERVHEHL